MYELLLPVFTAFGLGILIGAERERHQQKGHFHDFAGIRSFALLSLAGCISAILSERFYAHTIALSFFFVSILVLASYVYNTFVLRHDGVTTELAALISFLVGVLCLKWTTPAIVIAVLVTLTLSLKQYSHHLVRVIAEKELYACIEFAVIAFVILPLLPDTPVDPWGVIKPFSLWLVVVMICGIGFVGYILTRAVGMERGTRYTSFFGGIASSTALTGSFSVESKNMRKDNKAAYALVSGILIAIASSFFRILFFIFILNKDLFGLAIIPVAILFIVLIVISFFIRRWFYPSRHIPAGCAIKNPFQLKKAIEFTLILTLILIVAEMCQKNFGSAGLYMTSIFSGMVRGEAIAIAVSGLALNGTISQIVAVKAILLSISTSFISKSILAWVSGNRHFGGKLATALIVPFFVGIGLFLLL